MWFGETFKCVPLHIENNFAVRLTRNHTLSSRAKHVAPKLFYVDAIVQEGKISIYYMPNEDNISDLGTKFLSEHRHRHSLGLIKDFNG